MRGRKVEEKEGTDGRRLEYGGWNIERNHELVNYLKEEENLESLN